MSAALPVQMKGRGIFIRMIDVVSDGVGQFPDGWGRCRDAAILAQSRKKSSAMFSQDQPM